MHSTRTRRVERNATDRLHQHIRNKLPHYPLVVIKAAIEHGSEVFCDGATSMDIALKEAIALAHQIFDQKVAA